MPVRASPGTVVVYTDVACAWSTIALHRFYAERAKAGLEDAVRVDHRLFLLEDVNAFPLPKVHIDSEMPVLGALAPDFGFKLWTAEPSTYPVSALLANEAVHAAKDQSPQGAEELDMAIQHAFFAESRPIALLHELLEIAEDCAAVDADALHEALEDGRARGPMMRDYRAHRADVQGSPHSFLADGSDVHNPGIEFHSVGEEGGYPVIDSDDPSAIADLVQRAAASGR